jgi:gluconate 2-dehydrogenase gamma chain
MRRREVLRLLATGTALQFAPRNLLVTIAQARTLLGSPAGLRTLDAHQEAIVRMMTELILPRTDTAGAADVGATEFIDLMLTEWYEQAERTLFVKGLADVDARSRMLFGKDFTDCSPMQQADILTALGEHMVEEGAQPLPVESNSASETNFYAMLRRLTLTAYYTSEKGATEELHFEIIPGMYEGCRPTSPVKGVEEEK